MRTVNFLDSDTFSSESWVQNLYVFKSFYQSKHQKERMFVFLIFFSSKYTLDISQKMWQSAKPDFGQGRGLTSPSYAVLSYTCYSKK